MKPYPLAPLNHFTVPFSLTNCSFRLLFDHSSHQGSPPQNGSHRVGEEKGLLSSTSAPKSESRGPRALTRALDAQLTFQRSSTQGMDCYCEVRKHQPQN